MAKSSSFSKVPVKGGYIVRNAKTGEFWSVRSSHGVSKKTATSSKVVQEVSRRRSAALERLVNR